MSRLPRASGILAHPTSCPGRWGIGDLGAGTRLFLDFLAEARQELWQVLPLTPTGFGDSPYVAPSAFAGNPLLIDLAPLLERRLLDPGDLAPLERLPAEYVDYARLGPLKRQALEKAFHRFEQDRPVDWWTSFADFRAAEASWLDDFALFMALHEDPAIAPTWTDWPPALRDRAPAALSAASERYSDDLRYHAFAQFLFFQQWTALREEARRRGIRIVGDLPIFVAHNSADVWVYQRRFLLDERGLPTVVAGVPPDYFSATGQLWGNPLYDWDAMAAAGYHWWIERFRQLFRLVDVVRIDHFRGFRAAWAVPAGAETAVEGQWLDGPGAAVFRAIAQALGDVVAVIAEDLGLITGDVRALLAELAFPGMKVLQFAFGGGTDNPYLPHAYADPNCVVYTGTHDNDTTRGWYAAASEDERRFVRAYTDSDGEDVTWKLIRLALGSVADSAVIPLQDVLDLGSQARMNTPGAALGNWQWRCTAEQLDPGVARRLAELTRLFGRSRER